MGSRVFINRSLTGVERSGSCLQSKDMMAQSYTVYSVFVFCLSLPEKMCILLFVPQSYRPRRAWSRRWRQCRFGFLSMRAVLLLGLEEAFRSRRVRTFHAPKIIFFCLFGWLWGFLCCCCCCCLFVCLFVVFVLFSSLLRVKPPAAAG